MLKQWAANMFTSSPGEMQSHSEIYRMPRTSMIWILSALTSVILPHVIRMPVWLTLLCLFCIGISILIFQGRLSYPGSKLKTLVVFLVLFAIVAQYGRDIFSTDAIVGVLIVGVTLKLLELKKKRDVLMVIYLCYFTVLAEFIYSQVIPVAVYMVLCVLIITCSLMSITQTEEFQRPRRTLKLSALILLQSVPLMAFLFVLFPRIGPLWSMPLQSASAKTGLSESMAPGDIGDLTRSGDVAFTVAFDSNVPDYKDLYWRGLTLDRFDGREWSRGNNAFGRFLGANATRSTPWFDAIEYLGNTVSYSVIMEPTQQNWVFTLMVPQFLDDRMIMRQEYQVETRRPVSQRFNYQARSYLEHKVDARLSREIRGRTLSLPPDGNDNARAFAQELYEQAGSDRAYVNAVLDFIRNENFYYTLSPGLLGDNPIDDFLFRTREGFCEHYSGAFTFLMRAAGIPSRVVLGYQGGEFNKYNGTLIVRQYDAHAWSEVWFEDDGWVRIDPTAAVAPGRIEFGSQFTFQEDENFLNDDVFSILKLRSSSAIINDLILRKEMIEYAWNRFVLNYDQGMQFSLFSRLFDSVSQAKIYFTIFGLVILFVAVIAFLVLRKPAEKPLPPATSLYLKFCKFLADNGISRRAGETPLHFRDRVVAIQPGWKTDVCRITDIYMELAFASAGEGTEERMRQLRQAIRRFKVIN
jgi:transglutaminase-like putative cysteine protease